MIICPWCLQTVRERDVVAFGNCCPYCHSGIDPDRFPDMRFAEDGPEENEVRPSPLG